MCHQGENAQYCTMMKEIVVGIYESLLIFLLLHPVEYSSVLEHANIYNTIPQLISPFLGRQSPLFAF